MNPQANSATTSAKACRARDPWLSEDAYYKVKHHAPASEVGAEAQTHPFAAPLQLASSEGGTGNAFGAGKACSSAGKGCAGRMGQNVNFEKLTAPSGAVS